MEIEKVIEKKLREIFQDDSLVYDKSHFVGGMTNYNYLMKIKGKKYVVREPGGMTDRMIDRKIENINNQMVSEVGINSICIYFDETTGIKICEYVDESSNIALLNPNHSKNLQAVSNLMRKVHNTDKRFLNDFNFWEELRKYEGLVEEVKGNLFFDYEEGKRKLSKLMGDLLTEYPLVPCHNDTVPENFLMDQQGKSYLIDWEYSGLNDPNWDIASYILESELKEDAIDALLKMYYQGGVDTNEIVNIKLYMLAQDLLWTVWALIRHYHGDDFLDYCNNRYERFKKNIRALQMSTEYPIREMLKINN